MSVDVDNLLLDRVFQPAADRAAQWASCFALSRASLALALLLQLAVLALDLSVEGDPLRRYMALGITALALVGGQQAMTGITRAERQARPGAMNVRRITMRWQRLAWLAIALWAATVAAGSRTGANAGVCAACLAWLSCIYFLSCTASPPRVRISRRAYAYASAR